MTEEESLEALAAKVGLLAARARRRFAVECAARALPIYENEHVIEPDLRPRHAIEVSRSFADDRSGLESALCDAHAAARTARDEQSNVHRYAEEDETRQEAALEAVEAAVCASKPNDDPSMAIDTAMHAARAAGRAAQFAAQQAQGEYGPWIASRACEEAHDVERAWQLSWHEP